MVKTNEAQFEQITEATCDCCGANIKVQFGSLSDHLRISGYRNGQLLDAIVCTKCMDEKFTFVNIQRKNSTIGYC